MNPPSQVDFLRIKVQFMDRGNNKYKNNRIIEF